MKWFLAAVLLSTLCSAQQTPAVPAVTRQASVRFDFEWSQGFPWQKYTIVVQSNGKARFDGTPQPEGSYDTDPFHQDFTIPEASREKLFALAQNLNYFRGDFDSHLKHVAKTGVKTLQYDSPQIKSSTSYNWSKNPDVDELTKYFEGVANTIDYGCKLQFQQRFDKLGMDKRIKELQYLQASDEVRELQIIQPILRKIADDPNVMNISRQSAERLLRSISDSPRLEPSPAAQ